MNYGRDDFMAFQDKAQVKPETINPNRRRNVYPEEPGGNEQQQPKRGMKKLITCAELKGEVNCFHEEQRAEKPVLIEAPDGNNIEF